MKAIWTVLMLMPQIAAAAEWEPVTVDAEIRQTLAGRTLTFDAYTFQRFGEGGDTQYVTDRLSDGRWEARGGQYCSAWPPSDLWTCYDIEVQGKLVRFISVDGSNSTGTYRD